MEAELQYWPRRMKTEEQTKTPIGSVTDLNKFGDMNNEGRKPWKEKGVVSSKYVDDNIQEAIRLHEAENWKLLHKCLGDWQIYMERIML